MNAATVDVAALVGSVRGMVIRRLLNAGLVADVDDVLGNVACRAIDRLVLRGRDGDNPDAYIWPMAEGIVKDHIHDVAVRRGREHPYDELAVPGSIAGPDEDTQNVRRARRAVQLIEEAVGAERWEAVTAAVTGEVRRSSVDRSTRMWVRKVAGVILQAMILVDEIPAATDIDIAIRCLPEREGDIILSDIAALTSWQEGLTPSTIAAYRSRAEKLLFHARVAYDLWAHDRFR